MTSQICFVLKTFSILWDIEPTISSHKGPPNQLSPPLLPPAHFPLCLSLPHTCLSMMNLVFVHGELSTQPCLMYPEEPSRQDDRA